MVEPSDKIINCLFYLTLMSTSFMLIQSPESHLLCTEILTAIFNVYCSEFYFSHYEQRWQVSSPGSPMQTALPPLLIVRLPFVNPTVVRKNAVHHIFNHIHLSSAVSKTLHIRVYLRENNGIMLHRLARKTKVPSYKCWCEKVKLSHLLLLCIIEFMNKTRH